MVAIAAARCSVLALSDGPPPHALGEAIERLRATLLPLGRQTDADRNLLGARIDRFVGEQRSARAEPRPRAPGESSKPAFRKGFLGGPWVRRCDDSSQA